MFESGLASTRTLAQRLVMAGQVRVNGQVVLKPSTLVFKQDVVEVDHGPRFVSRGGEKLDAALSHFKMDVTGWICADVGSSTGGFTDCLLQRGASKVYALDVGQGILDWKLRRDARVIVMEGTNARYIPELPEHVKLVTVDASFISLNVLLPVLRGWLSATGGDVLALIKPQFEAGREEVRRGKGVIRDETIHRRVLQEVLNIAKGLGYQILGLMRSPLLGPKGNTEFLVWLGFPSSTDANDLDEIIQAGMATQGDAAGRNTS